MNLNALKDEFPAEDIEWRVQRQGLKDNRPWASIVPYVANRAIMDRLDEVCSPENWQNTFSFSPDGGFMCAISIKIGDEWVTKWDGAEKSDIEPFKGGLSNAMKRAAVQWGIGRFLYHMESQWAVFSDDGEYNTKIENHYYKWSPPNQKNNLKTTNHESPTTVKPPAQAPTTTKQETGEAASEQQKKAIHAIANSKGIERTKLFGIIGEIVSHKVESTDALTKQEASRTIEALNSMPEVSQTKTKSEDGLPF